MNFFGKLSAVMTALAIATFTPSIAVAREIEEIADLAREITVKVSQIDGDGNGSGVIIDRYENTYYAVTNSHVIVSGVNYNIQTVDGNSYPLRVYQEIPELDLAIVEFKSDRDYKLADLGNSENIVQLQTVYVAGFPDRQENMDIIDGKIRQINEEVYADPLLNEGYAWEYTNETFPGSSGGAVLDDDGRLIGINGQSEVTISGVEIRRGIPIHFLMDYLAENSLEDEEPEPQEIFETSYNDIVPIVFEDEHSITAVAISDDGAISVSSNGDEKIQVWDLYANTLERTLEGHEGLIGSIAINPDKQTIASGSDDGTIKIWNWASWELQQTLEDSEDRVNSIAWNANADILASGGSDETVKVWNVSNRKLERILEGHDDVVSSVALSPDGNTIASGSWDKTVKIWDWQTWELKQTLEDHQKRVNSVAISGDGNTVVSSSNDGTVKVWDLATGVLQQTLAGHQDIVHTIAISGDGRTIVSGSDDLTIKVWDLATGSLLYDLEGHEDLINSVAVSYDGKTIVSGSKDKTVRLWKLK